MVIRKEKNHMGTYDIILEENGKTLTISFQGNLDLYWQLFAKDDQENLTFTITKENYAIYSAFERLYSDIEACNVFKKYKKNTETESVEHLPYEEDFSSELNESLKKYRKYGEESLFKGGVIEWHCDDEPYNEANVLTISKRNDEFIVDIASNSRYLFGINSVRIRNSGSRYEPFNIVFMRMFNELQEYEPKCHQIHMEEIAYQKKKQLKK